MKTKSVMFYSVLGLFLSVLYMMGQIAIPFIIGFILSYALSIPVSFVSKKFKLSKSFVAAIFIVILVSIFSFLTAIIGPIIKNCVLLLIEKLPMLIEAIPRFFEAILAKIHPNGEIQLDAAMLERYSIEIAKAVPAYLINILNTGATILYSTVFVIMTPIVTFYLSKDWDKINKSFYSIIRKYTESKTVEIVIQKINRNLILYVNGQLTICTILAIFYTIFLFFVGVKEYIACGILSGFLSFAPFIGPCIGFAITIAVSVDCLQTIMQYILITALYVSVPFVDSYFLTPKLIGHKVGIKPFWILFAVSASTSILGTIGVFLAMPLAVIFSTILKEVYSKPND